MGKRPARAVLFVDGNNWYHGLATAGVQHQGSLDYVKISQKLVGPRDWIGTRYYVGRVRQQGNLKLYADQRSFTSRLQASDSRISVHFGRLEPRTVKSEAAIELKTYLAGLSTRIDRSVFHDLVDLANRHSKVEVMVEKAVDVMIAVDMVVMAERNEVDAIYLVSADGDFTPAVEAVCSSGKKVYAVSTGYGAQLAQAADAFIGLESDWFEDCY